MGISALLAIKVPVSTHTDKLSVKKGLKYACDQIYYNIYVDHLLWTMSCYVVRDSNALSHLKDIFT